MKTFAAIIDIRRWLAADQAHSFSDRLARDRALGREIRERDDVARVLAWWSLVNTRQEHDGRVAEAARFFSLPADFAPAGDHVERLRRLTMTGLFVAGVLAGGGAAAAAFAYDGSVPVNLFRILGLLVVLPGVLALAGLAAPWILARGVQANPLAALNLTRWAGALVDRLTGVDLFAPTPGSPVEVVSFARSQAMVFAQWASIGFFAGALAYALALVTFSDLAFGWSTTLELAPTTIQIGVNLLAAPWSGFWPAAAPDLALTEASQHFRGAAPALDAAAVARLGAWWPFVFMAVLCYGLLPRLLLLAWGLLRLRRATWALLREDAEVTALLDRLAQPLIQTSGADAGPPDTEPRDGAGSLPGAGTLPGADAAELIGASVHNSARVIIWNRALEADAARKWLGRCLALRVIGLVETGSIVPESVQRAALGDLLAGSQSRRSPPARLIIVTRGWEPPLLEFADFLGLVRELAGSAASITVVPVDLTGSRVDATDRLVWATTLARVRDPRLYVQEPVA